MNTIKIDLEISSDWNWLLYYQLKRCIQKDWKESLYMASYDSSDDVYFADRIDQTADIMLQLFNKNFC